MRGVLVVGVVLVGLAGCGGSGRKTASPPVTTAPPSTVAPTTTSTVDVVRADEGLVRDVLYQESQAWHGGFDAGIGQMLAVDYPALAADPGYKADLADCRKMLTGGGAPPAGYRVDTVMDEGSFRATPGFTLPDGALKGRPLDGRLYSFSATLTTSADGVAPQTSKETEHAAVVGGRAFLFFGCDR